MGGGEGGRWTVTPCQAAAAIPVVGYIHPFWINSLRRLFGRVVKASVSKDLLQRGPS